jgi:hypothetical protein
VASFSRKLLSANSELRANSEEVLDEEKSEVNDSNQDCKIGLQVKCRFGILVGLVSTDEFYHSKINLSGSVGVLEYSMMRISPSHRNLISKQFLV